MKLTDIITVIGGLVALIGASFTAYRAILQQVDRKLANLKRDLDLQNRKTLAVESGVIRLPPSPENSAYKLNSSEGAKPGFDNERSFTSKVHFRNRFLEPPEVRTCLTTLDLGSNTQPALPLSIPYYMNCRIKTQAHDVREDCFELETQTWDGTLIFKAEISWIAIGYRSH